MRTERDKLPNEDDVVTATCAFLERRDYAIHEKLRSTEQGIDIVARHRLKGSTVRVEAKGGTSSKKGTARYGKSFSNPQVFGRVCKAVYTALRLKAEYGDLVVIAVPDTDTFRRHLEPVQKHVLEAGISLFWVSPRPPWKVVLAEPSNLWHDV